MPESSHDKVRRVIEENLISIVFQPIVGLDQAGVIAFEALTRPDPESGFDSPDELFDAAEDADMTWELEALTRFAALRAASGWPAGTQLFLNCTPGVIADDRFTPTVLDEVKRIDGLSPTRIVLEVTERSEVKFTDGLQRQTAALQKHGFGIAIDDVGAGTSGLNRIMLLRPQWLKMDRALIAGIDQDPVRTNLIRFLTHFARLSGVSILAEGIERVEELDRLLQLGVDAVQGYLLGRPGEAGRAIDPPLAARITEQRAHGSCPVFHRDRDDTLGALAQPVRHARAHDSIGAVRQAMHADSRLIGAITVDADGTGRWCSRERITDPIHRDGMPLSELAVPFARTLQSKEKIHAGLEIAASLTEAGLDAAIAVADGPRIRGVARIRDLLRAGSEVCRVVRHRSATLTGLPGRVRCEQQLLRALREDAKRDAVFIDIRGLSDYNSVFGFELGDQLITSLVEVIEEAARQLVGLDADAAFLGHLGDDRLLLVADAGLARRIAIPAVQLFESRTITSGISPRVALAGVGDAPAVAGISLRYLIVPEINKGYATPQSLMQTEPILRAMADEQAAVDPTRAGYIVEAPRDTRSEPFLLAA
jgi:EAL domain-containing protein (putative c-di-GMP-specific phosphodiesterase class I)/GGDEF domain-containing protein